MDKQSIRAAFNEAKDLVTELPEHLQAKAFELAVGILLNNTSPRQPDPVDKRHDTSHSNRQSQSHGEHRPAVSDLLRACKDNLDRLIVFMHDAEERNDEIGPDTLMQRFATYKQDRPKNIHRDLGKLAARDWAEQHGRERGSPWMLKRKGRERYDDLARALNE